ETSACRKGGITAPVVELLEEEPRPTQGMSSQWLVVHRTQPRSPPMRPRQEARLSGTQIHRWALQWLLEARLLRDHGPLCTAMAVCNVLLHAAARLVSLSVACRDLSAAPSAQAVFRALQGGLPRTLPVLEGRLNDALLGVGLRRLRRRAWPVAIDWHLVPYYGRPQRSRNEIYCSKPRQGTTRV